LLQIEDLETGEYEMFIRGDQNHKI